VADLPIGAIAASWGPPKPLGPQQGFKHFFIGEKKEKFIKNIF
jgi:hypothetical protein